MRKFTKLASALALTAIIGFTQSCSDQNTVAPEIPTEISDDVRSQFTSLGFDVSDMRIVTDNNPLSDRKGSKHYLLEGDIAITPENLKSMLGSDVEHLGPVGEQYRTTNLVNGTRTLTVIGYTGGSNALTSKMRTALTQAIENYNNLNMRLSFTLSFSTSTNADIVVYRSSGSAGGVSGFPSGGNPYKWVQIFSQTDNYSTDVNEHVITHEIGHSLGLRHTDYFNRSLSCGTGGNEGPSQYGAIHISGTPTGYDASSIMLACFSSNENGEFGNSDRVALETIY